MLSQKDIVKALRKEFAISQEILVIDQFGRVQVKVKNWMEAPNLCKFLCNAFPGVPFSVQTYSGVDPQ